MESVQQELPGMAEGAKTSLEELESGLDRIRAAPADIGRVEMIVCRPAVGKRRILEEGELTLAEGLRGDSWKIRGSSSTPDGSAHPEMQLNLMNVRVIERVAGYRQAWPLAGDQFLVDFDLSKANVPPGTRLALGSAVIEVTAQPHLGCQKFQNRFGKDAVRFVNSAVGKQLNMRGINAKVVTPGVVRTGDTIRKVLFSTQSRD